jgi:hypothetical protein
LRTEFFNSYSPYRKLRICTAPGAGFVTYAKAISRQLEISH